MWLAALGNVDGYTLGSAKVYVCYDVENSHQSA